MATIPEALQVAMQHHQAGRFSEAEDIYRQIIAIDARHFETCYALAVILNQTQQYTAAIEFMIKTIGLLESGNNALPGIYQSLRQQLVASLSNNGNALQLEGNFNEAIRNYAKAIEIDPQYVAAYNNMGNAYQQLQQYDEAVRCYRQALAIEPNCVDVHINLGAALNLQGHYHEAVTHCRRVVELSPESAEGHNNLAAALIDIGNYEEAYQFCQHAISLQPEYGEASYNQATMNLRQGNFNAGWQGYERRWEVKGLDLKRLQHLKPEWQGEVQPNKTLLVEAEQGLGDTMQFIRYLSLIKQTGMRVLFRCPNVLVSLLNLSNLCDQILSEDSVFLPSYDFHIPLLSLPRIFNTDIMTIPALIPYLTAHPSLIDKWRLITKSNARFHVGVNWRGRSDNAHQIKRNLPLHEFANLSVIPGVHLVSLQKGVLAPWEQEFIAKNDIVKLGDEFDTTAGPFMDTAATMKNLDLVVTCDTSIAHLAGALGVPVWVALPYVPDWRWLLNREDSPWYPTMRLFRQTKRGEWGEVFERMAAALKNILH